MIQGVWAALRALEIDDQLADTHALLAQFRYVSDFKLEATRAEFQRAREIDLASPKVRFRYAITGLLPHGRLAETCAEFEAILKTDPLSGQVHGWLGATLQMQRDFEASGSALSPEMTKPGIITRSPTSAKPRVEMLVNRAPFSAPSAS